jgi:hypothetical protein
MPVRGAHRIAVNPLGFDPLAAAALDRVVQAQQHRTARDKGFQQQAEEVARGQPRLPDRAVEHPVIVENRRSFTSPARRRMGLTVRWPGARIAPIRTTSACHQLR